MAKRKPEVVENTEEASRPSSSHQVKKPRIQAQSEPNIDTSTKEDMDTKKLQKNASETSKSGPGKLQVNQEIGDLFAAPSNTVLIHACNCEGRWGAGIATVFKNLYPGAFAIYNKHCRSNKASELTGTTLLIPPSEKPSTGAPAHFIGCLFNSAKKGRGKDSASKILENTATAMQDLLGQANQWNKDEEPKIEALQMCQINSGKFGVKWERTLAVLNNVDAGHDETLSSVTVISRDED